MVEADVVAAPGVNRLVWEIGRFSGGFDDLSVEGKIRVVEAGADWAGGAVVLCDDGGGSVDDCGVDGFKGLSC